MGDELLESEERWRETFEQAGAGMAHVSLDGRFLRVNQCLCELTGYTRDELLQKRPTDLCLQEDNAADLTQWQRLLANEIPTLILSAPIAALRLRRLPTAAYLS